VSLPKLNAALSAGYRFDTFAEDARLTAFSDENLPANFDSCHGPST